MKTEDFADRNAAGGIPDDIARRAEPVTEGARKISDDEGRVHYDDEMMSSSLERAITVQRDFRIMTTGHYEIDDATGGLEKEFVWVIGADMSWGKSSNAIMVASENIDLGWMPLIVSWEDPEKLYADRILMRRARIDPYRFKWHRRGRLSLTSDELRQLKEAVAKKRHKPLFLDARGRSVEWVARQVRAIVASDGVDIVLADYLQAADNEKPQNGRKNEITYVARTITDAIKTSGAAGILYSQLTIKDGKTVPTRHDIKESRDVSNAAETVALGYETDKEICGKDGRLIAKPGDKVLFVDKVKDGPPKRIYRLDWNKDLAFFDATRRPLSAAEQARDAAIDDLAQPYPMPDMESPTPWNERGEREL